MRGWTSAQPRARASKFSVCKFWTFSICYQPWYKPEFEEGAWKVSQQHGSDVESYVSSSPFAPPKFPFRNILFFFFFLLLYVSQDISSQRYVNPDIANQHKPKQLLQFTLEPAIVASQHERVWTLKQEWAHRPSLWPFNRDLVSSWVFTIILQIFPTLLGWGLVLEEILFLSRLVSLFDQRPRA